MSVDRGRFAWRQVRGWVLAACAAWLVLQNLALAALFLILRPGDAVAAGLSVARSAFLIGVPVTALLVLVSAGLAFAAWLVHGVAERVDSKEVDHGSR